MREHLILSVLLICGYIAGQCAAQKARESEEAHQQPIGAYRIHQKTHFQCAGRPSGYYADVETGCQVYHMCDGLGRQFSYSCPNTTLFQQRMLICDHWYMVNCSRAESNYDANLLIGQKDKPFVTDQENELRTPRPDLLDRPYAADYLGESFRNQYKLSPASSNSLDDADSQKTDDAPFVRPNQPYTFATHWSTQHHSKVQSTVNPPAPLTPASLSNDLLPPLRNLQHAHNAPAAARQFASHSQDLALSSSQDSRRSEPESNFINSIPTDKTTTRSHVQKPVTHYTPPHAQPQYNINYAQFTQQQLPSTATAAAFTTHQLATDDSATTTDRAPPPSTVDDKTPQTFTKRPAVGHKDPFTANRGHTKFNHLKDKAGTKFPLGETSRILSRPANEPLFASSPASVPTPTAVGNQPPPLPNSDLLPPFDKLQIYDDATTQGPPIYSQWKIPSSGLLPPLLHAKQSRASPDNQLIAAAAAPTIKSVKSVPANSVPASALKRPANGLQPPRFESPATEAPSAHLLANSQHNLFRKSNLPQTTPVFPIFTAATEASIHPADVAAFSVHSRHHKSPTPRSVPPTTNTAFVSSKPVHTRDNHYLELKKLLHIPEYTFPLEADSAVRAHYVRDDSVNSFQVKIPLDVNDVTLDDAQTAPTTTATTATQQTTTLSPFTGTTNGGDGGTDGTDGTTVRTRRAPWYGENAACPECHPSFVRSGGCEPCVKIRR